MKLTQHPEYAVYLRNQETAQRCQEAIAQWRVCNEIIAVPFYALHWTYESAQGFVRILSQLFQAYNRVLWKGFNYCRQCGGQCCVVEASGVKPFDLLAIALLGLSPPALLATGAGERACIYLSNRRCSWPGEWRTIKCWSFYCLGAGPWEPGSSLGEMRGAITAELQQLVCNLLPDQLRRYEALHGLALADYLDDPVDFSDVLHHALCEIFVNPFNAVYPIMDTKEVSRHDGAIRQKNMPTKSLLLDDDVSAFIAETVEQLCEGSPAVPKELATSSEQLLEDLETLQWIIEGQPSHRAQLLESLYLRYANAPASGEGEEFSVWHRMRDYLGKMLYRCT